MKQESYNLWLWKKNSADAACKEWKKRSSPARISRKKYKAQTCSEKNKVQAQSKFSKIKIKPKFNERKFPRDRTLRHA